MEVLDRQEVYIAGLYPLLFLQGLTFWAVPVPAGVVRYLDMAATVALVLMPAQDCGPAYLDGTHYPQVIERHGVRSPVLQAVLTKDIRQFDAVRRPHQNDNYLLCFFRDYVEGTGDLCQIQTTHMEIDCGCCRRSVPQQQLYMMKACPCLDQVGRKAVP